MASLCRRPGLPHVRALAALILAHTLVYQAFGADRALLIGINDYQDSRIRDLRGCEDDVEAMRRVLIDDYGFVNGQIRVLIRGDATRAGILDAIDVWLIAGTQPGDRVLLYYSGHGSQKQCGADKPEEPDGYDEVLCAVDYNPETQANSILDDELNERLRLLDGRNVLVIVDACHSGSITKSINGRLRGIETIDTAQSVPKYIPPPGGSRYKDVFFRPPTTFAADSASRAGAGQLRSDNSGAANATRGAEQIIDEVRANYVALTSCADAQTSEEIRVRVGERYARRGAFTWLLAEGLSGPADANRNGEVTYREILAYVNERLRDPRYDLTQTPELRTRREFFSQPFLGRVLTSRGLPKVVEVSDDRVTINRGAQHGVRSNQTYEPADAGKATDESAIRIESVEQFLATARIKGVPSVKRGDHLRPKDVFYNPGCLAVWLAAAEADYSDDIVRERLRRRLQNADGILLVDEAVYADRTVRVERQSGKWVAAIYSRYGTLRSRAQYDDLAALGEGVAERLVMELLILQLARLEKSSNDLDLRLWLDGNRTTFIAYSDPRRRESERLRLGFRTSRDCYVMLISIDSTGRVDEDLLRDTFFVRAGVDQLLPPAGELALEAKPPAGRDVIYALATLGPPRHDRSIDTKSIHKRGTRETIDWITRAIGRRRKEPHDEHTTLETVMCLAREGWAVAKITVDTLPEE
ncbi:MAG: caspase family protein [Phycisphaerae bacterium]|nr:caspase family protein [Phycisphaerae bacterium]